MSKQVNEIVIRVSGDAKDLQPTIDQLTKLGKVDTENANTFKANAQKNKDTMNKAHGDFEKFSEGIKEVGLALGIAFSVEKIIEFGKEMVKAFREEEKSINALRFAITKVGGEGGAAFEKLIKQSEKLQKVSIFSGDQIRNAQSQLAILGLTSKQVEALTPKILDLASASGIDLATATDKVINGINGQTRGLKDVGIAFEDTGSKTKNLAILSEDLAKFQGATASALNTSAGAAQNLEHRFDSLLAKGGKFIDDQIKRTKELAVEYEDLFTKGADEATEGKAERARIDRLNKRNEEILKAVTEGDKMLAGQEAHAAKQRIELADSYIIEGTKRILKAKAGRSEEEFQASLTDEEKNDLAGQRRFIKEQKVERDFAKKLIEDLNNFYTEKNGIVKDATIKGENDAEAARLKELDRIKAYDKLVFEEAMKQYEELKKLQFSNETVLQKEDREFNERLKAAGIFGRERNSLTAFELSGLEALEKQHQKNIQDIQKTEHDKQLAEDKRIADEKLKLRTDENDKGLLAAKVYFQQRLLAGKISQKQFDKDLQDAELFRLKRQQANFKQGTKEWLDYQTQINAINISIQKKAAEETKAMLEKTLSGIGKIFDEIAQKAEADIDHQEELEKSFIETQTKLAIAGKDNTLAVEEAKLAELEKKRAQNQRKLKRQKEWEALLEAVISYNKEDPKTALIKALAQTAGIEGASALFMEDAGLIGVNNPTTRLSGRGWTRRHRSGKDRLVMAEEGEGMFSKKNIANIGGPASFMALKRRLDAGPLGDERRIPIERAMPYAVQQKEVVESVKELTQVIKDKPEYSIDWESKAEMDSMNITRMEKGIKEVTKIQLRRPKIG